MDRTDAATPTSLPHAKHYAETIVDYAARSTRCECM